MTRIPVSFRHAAAAVLLAALASCGGGGGDDEGGPSVLPSQGTLRISLTDAPACGFEKLFVTVQRVRVHMSASAADADGGWQEIVLATPQRIDLLSLSNGGLQLLGQTALPAGRYQQLRLVLEPNSAAAPLANAVQPIGGSEIALETPSALQSGLKLNANLDVSANQVADFAIDFEACKSVLRAGNSGRYLLKPVLSLIPLIGDAGQRIVGYLDARLAGGGATVSVQSNGQVLRATPTDASGRFVLYPVPAGTYELVIVASGRTNAVISGVPVSATAITQLGSETVRIVPPLIPATIAPLSGRLTVNGSSSDTGASVRALQLFSAGPQVEVGYAAADASTGQYAINLPTSSPVWLSYSPGATSFLFLIAGEDAGRYRIEANAPNQMAKSTTLTLTGATELNFTLP